MTTFLMIRHGESQSNRLNLFTGQGNVDLEENGVRQAELTADFLAEQYRIDAIYASDLLRAFRTRKALGDRIGLSVQTDKGLREIAAGLWESRNYALIRQEYPADYDVWLHDVGHARPTGGESVAELAVRVRKTLEAIAARHDGQTVAVATHATPIRTLQCFVQTGSLDAMKEIPWVSNASVTEFFFENGEWRIGAISRDAHLGELRTTLAKNV
jgi:broad specificity phosphatase PhoE